LNNESKQIKEMSFEEQSKERKMTAIKLVKSISFEPWWKIPNHGSEDFSSSEENGAKNPHIDRVFCVQIGIAC
jgi:hypothetical protein